jgi:hypothetical protein
MGLWSGEVIPSVVEGAEGGAGASSGENMAVRMLVLEIRFENGSLGREKTTEKKLKKRRSRVPW